LFNQVNMIHYMYKELTDIWKDKNNFSFFYLLNIGMLRCFVKQDSNLV